MQYWIFYLPGVGGDGFGNLLEHANNVYPADGTLQWRFRPFDRRPDEELKRPISFYQSRWCWSPVPFRRDGVISENLNSVYVQLVKEKKNTVITAHPKPYWLQIDSYKCRDIVETDQVKIFLYSTDYQRVQRDFFIKTGHANNTGKLTEEGFIGHFATSSAYWLTDKRFDMTIDIERAWRDWSYLKERLDRLGIDLDKKHYDQYLTYIDNL